MLQKCVCLLLALVSGPVGGQAPGKDPPPGATGVEPRADEILRRMSACLAGARQFSFEAQDLVDEMLDSGQKLQFSSVRRIMVRRPNKVSADIIGDIINEQVRYDGKTLTVVDNRQKAYVSIKAPDSLDATLDYAAERFGMAMPLADLVFSDPYQAVIGRVRQGRYIGLHKVRGVKCHHLAFRQEGLDWQIWIEDGDKPLPRKLVITYKSSPGQPQYIAFLGKWNLSRELPDSVFTVAIPQDVKRIDLEPASRKTPDGRLPPRQATTKSRVGK